MDGSMSSFSRSSIFRAAIAASLALACRPAAAQHAACDRVATTSIAFGRTAGNIKPDVVLLRADGALVKGDSGATAPFATIPIEQVRRLARRGWTGPFARLRTAPSHPTRIPDAARDFVELRSACGTKHVEYVTGQGPPAFRALYDSLSTLAGVNAPPR